MSLNPRIFAFLFFISILVGIVYGGQFLFPHNEPVKPIINSAMPIIIERYTTILVTPTPDGHVYFANEYQNGTRLLKSPYTFIRYNAVFEQDLKVTTIVYDYMFFEKLHWFNPTTYKYQEQLPRPNKKFCLIFITSWMDNIAGDDTRMWMFNRSYFSLYDENQSFMNTPIDYPYQLRYRELENIQTRDKTGAIQAFKSFRAYDESGDFVNSAGEYNDEQYYLRGGISNAIDGFLIFEVDKNTPANKLVVFARLHEMGFSQWRLEI